MPRDQKTIVVSFDFEKETKGAVRYAEADVAAGKEPVIGTLYLRKAHLDGKTPQKLTVTIKEG